MDEARRKKKEEQMKAQMEREEKEAQNSINQKKAIAEAELLTKQIMINESTDNKSDESDDNDHSQISNPE